MEYLMPRCDPDLDPMTLIQELYLDILRMYLCTKNELSRPRFSKVRELTRQADTDKETDVTEINTTPIFTVGNKYILLVHYSHGYSVMLW